MRLPTRFFAGVSATALVSASLLLTAPAAGAADDDAPESPGTTAAEELVETGSEEGGAAGATDAAGGAGDAGDADDAGDAGSSSDRPSDALAFDALAVAETVDVNLLNINDFHGRIDGLLNGAKDGLASSPTVQFAGTIEQLKTEYGDANSVLLSAGDNVGASLFPSAIRQDEPTIDILNALGLAASAVGNHEFDVGWADIARIESLMDAPLLGANVYWAGTDTPAMQEYAVIDVSGLRVAVIGAVTEETPTLVNPALLADVDFGNPVDAVNRVTAQIVEGDLADVIVAEYHEAAPEGGGAEVYEQIVSGTSADVDVIFTGHTHQAYVWDAPIAGTDRTRPVVQTGSYGQNIGQVVLTVDVHSNEIVASTARLVPVTKTPIQELIATFPAVEAVAQIVLDALVLADIEGSVVTGTLTAPVTRAFTNGQYVDGAFERTDASAEHRGQASTLGTLIANALRESMAALPAAPDFGVVNPGGIRADLIPSVDGEITVAQARAVLPFLNELSVATLTGAQVVTMLEQQWQRDQNGNVPSRPYLQLGLSDNVRYTYTEIEDPGADDGRTVGVISGVTINGVPLDLSATYRVGTFAFLAAGGDNFRVFEDASSVVNTGLLDWESWLKYLDGASPISPDFQRAGVKLDGIADRTLVAGEARTITVSNVDIPSVGAPLNTEVTASIDGVGVVGTGALVGGVAQVEVTVPADFTGQAALTFVVSPSGTVATVPVEVVSPLGSPEVALGVSSVSAGGLLAVNGAGWAPGAELRVELHSTPVVLGTVAAGSDGTFRGQFTIPANTTPGAHSIVVTDGAQSVSMPITVTAAAGSGSSGAGSATGSLATTGADASELLLPALAALLMIGGGIAAVAIRRRSRAEV